MNMDFDAVFERIKRATHTRTQVEVAQILGIRQSSISDAKRRKSVPADWFLTLLRVYGLNPDWVADGIEPKYLKPGMETVSVEESRADYGTSPSRSRVVQVSTMSGQGEDAFAPDHFMQLAIPDSFYTPELLVLQMDGASMEPCILRGAFVGVDPSAVRDSVRSGELYAVFMPHEGLVIRRLFIDGETSRIIMRAERPDHPEQSFPASERSSRVLGRVLWVMQQY